MGKYSLCDLESIYTLAVMFLFFLRFIFMKTEADSVEPSGLGPLPYLPLWGVSIIDWFYLNLSHPRNAQFTGHGAAHSTSL